MSQLTVHAAIVHELRKAPEQAEASLHLSKQPLPITELSTELIARLDNLFERKSDLLQGFLVGPDEELFPAHYQVWLEDGRSKQAFIHFSQEATTALKQRIEGAVGAKGGYLLFADYTIDEQRLLGIYFVRDTQGMVFVDDEQEERLRLSTIQYLDIDHMAMAARLLAGPGRNVQLIRHARTQSAISQYFTDWVGLDRAETSSELTHSFLEMVEELPIPKDRETGNAMEEGDFERALIQYAAKQPQQTVRVKDFDQHFYGNETPLQEMLAEGGNPALEDGFRVDRKALRSQYYYRAGFGGMSVTCTKEHFRAHQIEVDEGAGTILIRSEELASLLLDQLEGFRRQEERESNTSRVDAG